MNGGCPDDATLQEVIAGVADAECEAHLDECEACAQRLEELAGATAFQDQFGKAGAPGAHESFELTQLIDHLKASPLESAGTDDDANPIAERFPAGAQLDGYRIEELIARGGMGVVLRAYDPELERPVAIKLLDPARFSGSEAAARFLREARAAAAIDHEHVLPIFTTGTIEELPYLVMPFVEGETLQDRVEREGALAADEAARIAKGVSEGLAAAHAAGLVHRDVKPANILLEPEGGRVWIADFGLARAAEDTSATREGVVAGTPQFMSPEQAEGDDADERSDLFSLGAVIYFMLSGKPPFVGDSPLTVLRQVADSSPDWSQAGAPPAWLGRVVRRLMSKDPKARPASATEVSGLLGLEQGRRRRVAWQWVAAALVLALGVAIFSVHKRADDLVGEQVTAVVDGERFILLAEAIESAPSGAVLEIVRDVVFDASTLPILDRPLTIRAAVGVAVELNRADLLAPVLDVRADVRLENLKITQPLLVPGAGEHLPPLVRIGDGGKATLIGCSVTRARRGKPHGRSDGADGGPPVCIDVAPDAALVLLRTELASGASIGVGLREGARADVAESVIGCEFAFVCREKSAVSLRRSAFLGLSVFTVAGEIGVEIEIDSNSFLSVGTILWTQSPLADANVVMRSKGNLYCPQLGYACTGLPARGRPLPSEVTIGSAAKWTEFANEQDGVSIELSRPRVRQMIREFNIADLHSVPELALERIRIAFRGLSEEFPDMGCDVDAAGVGLLP